MKIENIIYDIKHLLNALSDDTRVSDAHLIFKINNYWALFIKEEIRITGIVSTALFQRIPLITVYPVTSADDPAVTGGTIKFGKIKIPPLVDIGRQEPPMNLFTSERHKRIYYSDRDLLMEMIQAKDERLDQFKFYIIEGTTVYIYPVVPSVSFSGILQNPMEASLFYTTPEPLFNLTVGVEYIVTSGSVKEETTIYIKGESFTCLANTTYSGDGVVYRSTKVLDATVDMDYPISPDLAERIVLEILTKDFMLEKQSVVDIFNDAIDEFKSIKSKR